MNLKHGDVLLVRIDPHAHPDALRAIHRSCHDLWEKRLKDEGVMIFIITNDIKFEKISFDEREKLDTLQKEQGIRFLTVGEDWIEETKKEM